MQGAPVPKNVGRSQKERRMSSLYYDKKIIDSVEDLPISRAKMTAAVEHEFTAYSFCPSIKTEGDIWGGLAVKY